MHLTSEEGLPGTTATDLAVDTAGFVWLGTDSGLARWDGTHLKDISSLIRRLPTSNVTAVEADPTNGVWIAAGMLTYVSGDDLSVLPTTIPAEKIAVDGDNVWAISRDSVVRYSRNTGIAAESVRFAALRADGIETALAVDAFDNLLIGTAVGLTRITPDGTVTTITIPKGVLGVATAKDRTVWVTSESGLWTVPSAGGLPRRIATSDDMPSDARPSSALAESEDGSMLMGTTSGQILRWDESAWSAIDLETTFQPAPSGSITSIASGQDGMWFSTSRSGAHFLGSGSTPVWTIRPEGLDNSILGVSDVAADDASGVLWLATDGAGLQRVDLNAKRWAVSDGFVASSNGKGLPTDSITSIAWSDGSLWVSSFEGIGRLDTSTGEYTPINVAQTKEVGIVRADEQSWAWASILGYGVQVFDSGGRLRLDLPAASTIVNRTALDIEHFNQLAYIGGREGLDIVSGDRSARSWTLARLGMSGAVHDVEVLSPTEVWLASSDGISRFNPESGAVQHIALSPQARPVRALQIGKITGTNRLWVATSSGLVVIDRTENAVVREFTTPTGPSEYQFSGTGNHTAGGITYVSSSNGLVAIAKAAGVSTEQPSSPRITALTIDGELFDTTRPAEISVSARNIAVDFIDSASAAQGHETLSYRMEGLDSHWIRADGARRTIQYSSLPPGHYTFMVRPSSDDDRGAATMAAIEIIVNGPWWTETRVIATVALSFVALSSLAWFWRGRAQRIRSLQLSSLVAERTAALEVAANEIEEISQSKSRLMSAVSHDLRTPLTSILGYSELIGNLDGLPRVAVEWANRAGDAALHLNSLIDELADMARFEGRAVRLEVQPVSIREVVEHCVHLCGSDAENESAKLPDVTITIDDELSDMYRTDRVRLSRILVNLISNAIDHGEHSPVEITIGLEGKPAEGIDSVRFAVKDNGPGVAPENMTSIFNPFERSQPRNRKHMGLGLTVAKQLVERFGGDLRVSSTLGEFTEFEFTLDLPIAARFDEIEGLSNVLIIEDDANVRQLLEDELAMLGVRAVLVASGDAAIDCLDETEFSFVLADHHLNGELGSDVALRIRSHPNGADLPIVALSANPQEASRYPIYLTVAAKPMSLAQLNALIRNHITDRSSRRPSAVAKTDEPRRNDVVAK